MAPAEKEKMNSAIITYEKYLELFDNVAVLLRKTKSIKQMNEILRTFYSNLTVKGEKVGPKYTITRWGVVGCKLREPYNTYLKNNDFELS